MTKGLIERQSLLEEAGCFLEKLKDQITPTVQFGEQFSLLC